MKDLNKKEIIQDIIFLFGVILLVILAEKFLILNARIPSESMQNTVMVGDRIFGNRMAYAKEDPKRYDIVIFRYPDEPEKLLIKRVIGLPGDIVDIHDGDVFINGDPIPLSDDFCAIPDVTDTGFLTFPFTVPEHSYFVLGDNRTNSKDSRYWNTPFVDRKDILAEAALRYWPLSQFGVISSHSDEYYQPIGVQ